MTGAGGQVGTEIARLAPTVGVDGIALMRSHLDVTDAGAVRQSVAQHAPDAVVHAAAFTAVDRAEAEPEAAFAVNRDGAAHVADACAALGVPLVHLSTDYVFDGAQNGPYAPSDPVSPLNVYGASKAAGEAAVRARLDRHVILRTAWVFAAHGRNFVRTILRLAGERDRLAVVADQWGHPTWAGDVARAALAAATLAAEGRAPWGTHHVAGAPLATWHDLAVAVVEAAPGVAVPVDAVPSSAYPTAAARPPRVALELGWDALGLETPRWRPAVAAVVRELLRG